MPFGLDARQYERSQGRDRPHHREAKLGKVFDQAALGPRLTKDDGDKIDLLRAVLRKAEYQLNPEGEMMKRRKEEKEARKARGQDRAQQNLLRKPLV